MIRYLLDTNIVSEPAKPDPSGAVLSRLRERSEEVALPSIAWHELVYGAERMDEGRKQTYLLEYLRAVVRPSMPILPYDAEASQWHGRARALLEQEGRPTPFADGQIAAIAGTRDLNDDIGNIETSRAEDRRRNLFWKPKPYIEDVPRDEPEGRAAACSDEGWPTPGGISRTETDQVFRRPGAQARRSSRTAPSRLSVLDPHRVHIGEYAIPMPTLTIGGVAPEQKINGQVERRCRSTKK